MEGPLGLHFTLLGGREGIGRVHLELHNNDAIQHTYQLYPENGCVIHIWEMALSEPLPSGLYIDST